KYPGKTNEQFTALLLNLTLAAAGVVPPPPEAPVPARRPCVLDPLAGRGTTLLVAWRAGCDAAGVEADGAAFEAMAAYVTTYLRRTRRHHRAETTPVRRDRRKLGRRFDATWLDASLTLTVFTGDTRDSAMLYGKRRFDAVVTDAPYGVVHGAREASGPRDRSPAQLLREALPVWAGQLRPGGALGLSWNTYSLARSDLLGLVRASGLEPCTGGPWDRLAHRVDASIERDLVVAVRPAT
ncbi:MAG: site-specific DNA-methyltransferase, partial [Actinomycetia bacterium]|nr:site-specific DNA-methyltransferase [Actinomycetes bacterium]